MSGFFSAVIAATIGGTVVGTAAVLRRSIMYIVIFSGLVMLINSFKTDVATAYSTHKANQREEAQRQHALELERVRVNQLAQQAQHALAQERARLDFLKAQQEREAQLEEKMTRREREEYQRRREAQRQAALRAEEERAAAAAAAQVRQQRQAEATEMEKNMAILENLVNMQNLRTR